MSHGAAAALGAIAGATIFIGLPIGRVRGISRTLQGFLNAVATGVLLFLLWDILSHAAIPIETSLAGVRHGDRGFAALRRRRIEVILLLEPTEVIERLVDREPRRPARNRELPPRFQRHDPGDLRVDRGLRASQVGRVARHGARTVEEERMRHLRRDRSASGLRKVFTKWTWPR